LAAIRGFIVGIWFAKIAVVGRLDFISPLPPAAHGLSRQ
jgi:hypothetical protein